MMEEGRSGSSVEYEVQRLRRSYLRARARREKQQIFAHRDTHGKKACCAHKVHGPEVERRFERRWGAHGTDTQVRCVLRTSGTLQGALKLLGVCGAEERKVAARNEMFSMHALNVAACTRSASQGPSSTFGDVLTRLLPQQLSLDVSRHRAPKEDATDNSDNCLATTLLAESPDPGEPTGHDSAAESLPEVPSEVVLREAPTTRGELRCASLQTSARLKDLVRKSASRRREEGGGSGGGGEGREEGDSTFVTTAAAPPSPSGAAEVRFDRVSAFDILATCAEGGGVAPPNTARTPQPPAVGHQARRPHSARPALIADHAGFFEGLRQDKRAFLSKVSADLSMYNTRRLQVRERKAAELQATLKRSWAEALRHVLRVGAAEQSRQAASYRLQCRVKIAEELKGQMRQMFGACITDGAGAIMDEVCAFIVAHELDDTRRAEWFEALLEKVTGRACLLDDSVSVLSSVRKYFGVSEQQFAEHLRHKMHNVTVSWEAEIEARCTPRPPSANPPQTSKHADRPVQFGSLN